MTVLALPRGSASLFTVNWCTTVDPSTQQTRCVGQSDGNGPKKKQLIPLQYP
jgi:hypothetical protein